LNQYIYSYQAPLLLTYIQDYIVIIGIY